MVLREKRDEKVERLRAQYAPRIAGLKDRQVRATQRVQREQAQLSQQKIQTVFSVGTTILGALLGRKALSAATLGRAGTAARSAGRIASESADVENAAESLETVNQRLADLQGELEQEIARLEGEWSAEAVALEKSQVKPRKSDITVATALVWVSTA